MSHTALNEFADRIHEIMPVLLREFTKRHRDELYTGKITLPQFFILNFLSRQGKSKMTDLAHFMDVTTAAMTGIVDRLVKSGYLTRVFDPNDRRIIKIRLSAKGSGLVKKVYQHRRNTIMQIFGRISEEEREGYLKILMHIYDILTKEKEA